MIFSCRDIAYAVYVLVFGLWSVHPSLFLFAVCSGCSTTLRHCDSQALRVELAACRWWRKIALTNLSNTIFCKASLVDQNVTSGLMRSACKLCMCVCASLGARWWDSSQQIHRLQELPHDAVHVCSWVRLPWSTGQFAVAAACWRMLHVAQWMTLLNDLIATCPYRSITSLLALAENAAYECLAVPV